MNKYIIKNCPACRQYNVFGVDDKPCCYSEMEYCQDCSDCVMKQIVELLKSPNNCRYSGKPLVFTDNVLALLDIEEVE